MRRTTFSYLLRHTHIPSCRTNVLTSLAALNDTKTGSLFKHKQHAYFYLEFPDGDQKKKVIEIKFRLTSKMSKMKHFKL